MDRTSEEIEAVRKECLDLLIVLYSYIQSSNTYNPSKGTRFDMHRWWVSLRVFENDIIMRLCRLDDTRKSCHSLREALKSVRNEIPQDQLKAIDCKLKDYRSLINPLKTKARNYYLAHLSKQASAPYDPEGGLEKPVEAVVNLVDAIVGSPVNYYLSVGSQEKMLNLKDELSKP